MDDWRMWCLEITVSALADQQGAGFMTLVNNLLLADVHSRPLEPTYVSHPIMDVVLQDERGLRLEHIYFLLTVAWQVMLAFVCFPIHVSKHAISYWCIHLQYGVEEPAFIATPIDSVKRRLKRFGVKDYGPEVAARMMREYKEENKEARHSCWHCHKTESSSNKFSACSTCRQKAHCYIHYCSKYAVSVSIRICFV